MQHISEITAKQLTTGITGRYVHGHESTVGWLDIEKGSVLPLHHHIHEQITFILEGELEMTIGGETMILKPGCFHVIPSNVPHTAVALSNCKVIDVFHPVREDYK